VSVNNETEWGSFGLQDKIALVTGGSRGIGRAIATALARAGATVVIASRKLEACQAAAAEMANETGARVVPRAFHAGRWDESSALADDVYDEFGACDVLVNNAGVSPRYSSLGEITEDYYDRVTATNVKGAFRLSVSLGERMAAGAGGSIINVSTIGSLRPGAGELVYSMAKAGLNALTIGLAEAYAPKVRANAILPGVVRTAISNAWTPEELERFSAAVPVGRLGRPEDVALTALWLASPASSFVSGTLVRVDGGQFRQMS
jgi:NAD(P)-dependent dehydrogenase (short-subunit alcohol dehydrogenase family)